MKHLIIHVTFWMFHVKIKEIIVVEGKSDYTLLKSFLDVEIIITNGSEISKETLDLIKKANETKGVIILTDPDYPGQKIRNEISSYLPVCKHAFVRKEYSIKHHKVGVAEASKEEVLRALENVVTFDSYNKGSLTETDLFLLNISGLNSSKNKQKVIEYYHLGVCNSKTLLKRLNLLGVNKEDLEKIINDK